MYYKEKLSLSIISTSYFDQCLLCEVTCQTQKGYIAVIYCSPNQSCNEFEDFLFNLEKLINQIKQLKPSFTIILGDSNAKSSDWFLDDITSPEGTHNFLISMCGFDQLISDRTHYYLLHPPVLTLFLLINLIQWLIVVFTPFMPIATTKLHNVILIL